MADYFTPLLLEVYGVVNTVWPEAILPGGASVSNVFTSVQAFRKNFEAEAQNSQLNLADAVPPPYIVVSIGDSLDEPEFGLITRFKRARIQIFYLWAASDGGTQDAINAKLKALLDYIDSHDYDGTPAQFTNFEVVEFGRLNSSETNPWNAQALGGNKGELLGGHVVWEPGWLVGP
jgi:hypothetical protein